MKKLEVKKELTEEEQDALDAYHTEVELYEKFELTGFVEQIPLYVKMTPEQVLQALDIMFWHGYFAKKIEIPVARFKPEIAMLLDKAVDDKRLTRQQVADILADQYHKAYVERSE